MSCGHRARMADAHDLGPLRCAGRSFFMVAALAGKGGLAIFSALMSDIPIDRRAPFMAGPRDGDPADPEIGVVTRTRTRPKKPTPYKVLMLNDDYTPMEFVVLCLQRFFRMNLEDATRVMLHVHQKGVGVCGVFSYEVAETKVTQVMDFARQNQHPLQCTLEKA